MKRRGPLSGEREGAGRRSTVEERRGRWWSRHQKFCRSSMQTKTFSFSQHENKCGQRTTKYNSLMNNLIHISISIKMYSRSSPSSVIIPTGSSCRACQIYLTWLGLNEATSIDETPRKRKKMNSIFFYLCNLTDRHSLPFLFSNNNDTLRRRVHSCGDLIDC